jgi:hypothetical protein
MANQLRETSVPHIRLIQPLPPLPNRRPHQLSISIPYRDDPEEDEEVGELEGLQTERSPPGYEPMYDYLRSQQRPNSQALYHDCQTLPHSSAAEIPYRDRPFVITMTDHEHGPSDTTQPPPSYNEIYNPNEIEMRNLLQQYGLDGTPAEQTEEICKWIVAMLLIALTIAGVGTAFNWGQPSCQRPNRTAWRC